MSDGAARRRGNRTRTTRPGAITGSVPSLHQPQRPSWLCTACREEWPCARRRDELRLEFSGHRLMLALYMARYLHDALADHPDAVESVLYLRFLGWFRDGPR